RAVNCLNPVGGNPCGECDICRGIESGAVLDVTEMDAASNNGVDDVRLIRDEAVYAPVAARRRVYIIDEVHMLSRQAFNALLKIMEEPPEHLIFILATTELYKVPATILSRCQRYAFRRVPAELIRQRLLQVAAAEDMELTEEAAGLLSRLADGALRDALSLLDQCSGTRIDRERVLSAVGPAENEEICRMAGALLSGDADGALGILDALYRGGKDVSSTLGQLASLYRDILLGRTAPRNGASLMSGGYSEVALARLSAAAGTGELLRGLETVQSTIARLDRSGDRRLAAELCLLSLALPKEEVPAAAPASPPARPSAPAAPAREETKAAAAPKAEEAKAPPVPKPEEAPPAPPAREEAKAPEARSAGPEKLSEGWLRKPEEAPPAKAAPDVTWAQVLAELEKTMFYPDYSLISNGQNLAGSLEDGVLTLYTKNDTVKDILDAQRLEEIRAAASALTGSAAPVKVEPFREESSNGADKLNELMDKYHFN
ncbi:MAG: DNA polymerase III subunit gamma/tau, partial [Oscillospiraceae bacterium]|nr:DNA polymerase III subunit gamma/tau [Oscillospiraceae bacterium]